jgi:DNA polymerase-3 subunit delta
MKPVHLVRGEDPSLVRDHVMALVDELVGDGDRSLVVEELSGDDYELAAVVDAAQTPPFLTDRRVVVARDAHRFASVDAVAPLVAYLGDPLPTTALVLAWESGRVPKTLLDAVKKSGGIHVDTAPGKGWVAEHLAVAAVKLDARAGKLIADQLGEDVARLRGLLETLEAAFGPGARLTADDVAPFIGESGGVAPWELTDAIDKGDIPAAIERLHRMVHGGERHPLALLGTLHGHFGRILALDGADAANDKQAAALLGMDARRSTYPARKALDASRRLGHDRVAKAVALLAAADLDLKGERDLPPELVLEVLVARLAALSRR